MQPFLIVSGTAEKRKVKAASFIKAADPELLRPNHPDLIVLDSDVSLGIEEIRRFQKNISFKPFRAKFKAAIIPFAEKLTIPAQNAFLKTLEEPPASTLILLLAPQASLLLPTVVSRCRLITLPAPSDRPADPEIMALTARLLTGGVGERLRIAEGYKNREAALGLAGSLLVVWRSLLLEKGTSSRSDQLRSPALTAAPFNRVPLTQIAAALRKTEEARRLLVANINPQLTLDNLFLSYPQVHPKGGLG